MCSSQTKQDIRQNFDELSYWYDKKGEYYKLLKVKKICLNHLKATDMAFQNHLSRDLQRVYLVKICLKRYLQNPPDNLRSLPLQK